IVSAIAALSDVASAQNVDKTLDAIDFLVDAPDLIGKRVTVTGCSFESADSRSVKCRGPNYTGSIYIDSKTPRLRVRNVLGTTAKQWGGPARSPNERRSETGP